MTHPQPPLGYSGEDFNLSAPERHSDGSWVCRLKSPQPHLLPDRCYWNSAFGAATNLACHCYLWRSKFLPARARDHLLARLDDWQYSNNQDAQLNALSIESLAELLGKAVRDTAELDAVLFATDDSTAKSVALSTASQIQSKKSIRKKPNVFLSELVTVKPVVAQKPKPRFLRAVVPTFEFSIEMPSNTTPSRCTISSTNIRSLNRFHSGANQFEALLNALVFVGVEVAQRIEQFSSDEAITWLLPFARYEKLRTLACLRGEQVSTRWSIKQQLVAELALATKRLEHRQRAMLKKT